MTNTEFSTRIKHKRDLEENWVTNNPILLDGELIIVDTASGLKLKVGNGVDSYLYLPFYGSIYSERPEYSYTEIIGLSNELNKLQMQINAVQVIPSGMIMIWNGSVSEIPYGWTLCNGENGTPDLTDKFVLGAGNNYFVGLTGGETETILTVDQIPSHTHGYKRHAFNNKDLDQVIDENVYGVSNKTIDAYMGTTESAGGNQPHSNMPPYYALCYIMKI